MFFPNKIFFPPALWSGRHLPIGFFLFYSLYSKHLGLSAKNRGLLSVLESSPFRSSLSNIFPEAVPKLSAYFLSLAISARAAEVFCSPNLIGGLCSCRRVDFLLRSHLAGFFGLFLVKKGSLLYQGSEILGGTDPHLQAMSW